jgi:probable O-glycosylation ligase (exosortase A-associated)
MRDIALTLIVIVGCGYTLKKPYIGVLLWSWLSYMNPHRLTYGFAYEMPFAQVTAIALFMGMFLTSKDVKKPPLNKITVVWIIFIIWMGFTTLLAYFPTEAGTYYLRVVKIQLVVFLTMMLITDLQKLRQLIWVIVFSIGFYSVKGGLFTVLTGGTYRVWGPPGSYIEDNNSLAVAILMVVPFMIYLYQTTDKKFIKRILLVSIPLSFFTVLGSQSRGALIAIVTVGFVYWVKSKRKIVTAFFTLILAGVLVTFMPSTWHERMNTIETYDSDASAMGRINAWEYAYHAANHNIFGMGFESWMPSTFALYAPNPTDVHAAHSIYFSVLADHGWIGLIMYLMIYFMSWRALSRILKQTAIDPMLKEYNILARMLQISFIAYFSGGAFLSLSYFDLPWHLISFVILLEIFVLQQSVNEQPITHKRGPIR